MQVVILTAFRHGACSHFLPGLVEHDGIDVRMIILSHEVALSRWKRTKRKLRKMRRIGLLGTLTGFYLRTWNRGPAAPDLYDVADSCGIPVETTPRFRCDQTRELIRKSGAELGLTLGTPIIPPSVFNIPEYGMINVHGDVLPRFRGGHSVIWPIYEGVQEAGFSIHQLDRGIDTGRLLYVERFPIELQPTLKETYQVNVSQIQRRVPSALARVVAGYHDFAANASTQEEGTTYTTPTLGQFLRMLRQHKRLLREAGAGSKTADNR